MTRLIAAALLIVLGACFYAPGGGSATPSNTSGSVGGPSDPTAGGPGPGEVPTNPSAPNGH
jgi:hypothetical protein